MFEGYTDKKNNTRGYKEKTGMNENHMKTTIEDPITLPPPRPPPPTEYVNDAFMTSNYFSLPRNSRTICNSDENLSASVNNNDNRNILKSASFSNFSRTVKETEPANRLLNPHNQNKLIHRPATFDDYITTTRPTEDQQKITGRIIG